MPLALPLWVLLMQPPEDATTPAETEAPAETETVERSDAEFEAAWSRLSAAIGAASVGQPTDEIITELEQATDDFASFDRQLVDEDSFEGAGADLLSARIVLARTYYFTVDPPDPARGDAILDGILRTSDSSTVLDDILGIKKELVPIAKKRLAKIEREGKATVHVLCHTSCFVAVDHRVVSVTQGEVTIDVYLGTHEVTIVSTDPDVGDMVESSGVTLREAGEVAELEFGEPPVEPELVGPEPIEDLGPDPNPTPPVIASVEGPKRILPRWAEITGLVTGSALIGMGAGLWTTNNMCADPFGPADETCPQLWKSGPGTGIGLGLGGALVITSTVLLVIDEGRVRKGQQEDARVQLLPNGVLRF